MDRKYRHENIRIIRYETSRYPLASASRTSTNLTSTRSRHTSEAFVPLEIGIPQETISLAATPSLPPDPLTVQIYSELVRLEEKYVKALHRLSQLGKELKDKFPGGYHRGIQQMFSKIPKILEVHEKILPICRGYLNNLYQPKHPDSCFKIVESWICEEIKEDLRNHYPPYINYYNPVHFSACYDNLMATNQTFHNVVKKAESHSDWERLRVKDLLIMPVQHLIQLQLVFNEAIRKVAAAKGNTKNLSDAAKCIEKINRESNTSKTRVENGEKHLKALKDIRDLPASLISFNRQLIISASLRLLAGFEPWANERRPVRLFLLDDCLVVCKIRRNEQSGTLRRLRSAVFSHESPKQDLQNFYVESPQKLRYQQHYPLEMIRGIHALGLAQARVYVLIIRSVNADMELTFVVENAQDSAENVNALMKTMRKNIIKLHNRDVFEQFEDEKVYSYPLPGVLSTLKHSQLLSSSTTSLVSNGVLSQADRISLYGSQKIAEENYKSHEFVRRMSLQEPESYPASLLEASMRQKKQGRIRRTLSNISLVLTRPFRRQPNYQSASAAGSRTNSICGPPDSPSVSVECFPSIELTPHCYDDSIVSNLKEEEEEEGNCQTELPYIPANCTFSAAAYRRRYS